MEDRGTPAYVAEFIGTFFLVLFITTVVVLNSQSGLGFTDFAVIGLVHAFVLMVLIYTLGGVSGGHFNPAVTVAIAAIRRIAPVEAAIYILLQLAGGVAAVLVTKLILLDEGKGAVNYGAVGISQQFLQGKALSGAFVELIGTFLLVWAIMGAAVNTRRDAHWAPLIIGSTLGLIVMVFAPLTGAGFNPARAFGPAVVASAFNGTGDWLLAYVAGPVVGALAAAFLYRWLVLDREEAVIATHAQAGAAAPVGREEI